MAAAIHVLLVGKSPTKRQRINDLLQHTDGAELSHGEHWKDCPVSLVEQVDVILWDPPGAGWLDALHAMQLVTELPVVVLTADEELGHSLVQAGAQDFVDIEEIPGSLLLRLLRNAVERHASQRQLQHMNACLRSIRDLDRVISREQDVQALIETACRNLVRERNYRCIQISLDDAEGETSAYACEAKCGRHNADGSIEGCPFCRYALDSITKDGSLIVRNGDIAHSDPIATDSCRRSATMATCLSYAGRQLGRIVAVVPGDFVAQPDEETLFRDIADDIAHAVHSIEVRKEHEELFQALQKSERQHSFIVDKLPNGFIHVLDREYRFLFSHGNFLNEIGLEPQDMLSKSVYDFAADPVTLIKQLQPAFEGEEIAFEKDYGKRSFMVHAAPLEREDDRITSIITLGVDITPLKQAQAEAERLQETVRQMEKINAIGQLAGGIAHDFNNQLGAILGYAEILSAQLNTDDMLHTYANAIVTATRRSAELTNELLTFARKREVKRIPINLHDLIREVCFLLKRSIGKNITVKTCLDAPQVMTMGEPAQLQNLLLNLAINARDAMPDGGEIRLESACVELGPDSELVQQFEIENGPYVKLSVTDTGIGMSEETQSRIFEPFFTTKTEGKGTGMGLASVYGTVRAHDGAITCRSAEGQGTVFSVYFRQAGAVYDAEIKEDEKLVPGYARILVVDDEDVVRTMARDTLSLLGYEVIDFGSPGKAVDYYAKNSADIDLVVLDIEMPQISGFDAYREMAAINPELRVLVISGFCEEEEINGIITSEHFSFIRKPFRIAVLSREVAALLPAAPAK